MKRCDELRDLSEDHHHGLVLAQRSKRASGDVEAAWRDAAARHEAELEPHFRAEEAALLPALRAAGEADLADRIAEEHAGLRAHFAPGAARDAGSLQAFGALLEAHIRFEERVVFQRAQELLPEVPLASIRAARDAASVRRIGCLPPG